MLNHISRYTCTGCHQVAPAPGSARWSRGRDAGRTKDFGSESTAVNLQGIGLF